MYILYCLLDNSMQNNIIPIKVLPLKTSLCNSHGTSNSCSTFFLTDDTVSEGSTYIDFYILSHTSNLKFSMSFQ